MVYVWFFWWCEVWFCSCEKIVVNFFRNSNLINVIIDIFEDSVVMYGNWSIVVFCFCVLVCINKWILYGVLNLYFILVFLFVVCYVNKFVVCGCFVIIDDVEYNFLGFCWNEKIEGRE